MSRLRAILHDLFSRDGRVARMADEMCRWVHPGQSHDAYHGRTK